MSGPLSRGFRVRVACALPLWAAGATACAAQPGALVSAPSDPGPASARGAGAGRAERAGTSGAPADLDACALPWTLQSVAEGSSGVVVACGSDVRREPLSLASAAARAIAPALEPARERLCACAARLPVPPFVDLTVTATVAEGRATAQASELDDEMDPERGPPFVACIGTVTARFTPFDASGVCPGVRGNGNVTVSYPIRVELIR